MAAKVVCAECFEKHGKSGGSYLIERRCLSSSEHAGGPNVRVRLTSRNALEPVIRPMPRVHFRGEFRVCTGKGCKGLDKCTFAHCLKEKKIWNAEKFAVNLPPSEPGTPAHGPPQREEPHEPLVSSRPLFHTPPEQFPAQQHAQLPLTEDPWPDFPGFGAETLQQLWHPQEAIPPQIQIPIQQHPLVVSEAASPPKSYASAASQPHRTGVRSPPAHFSVHASSPPSRAPMPPPSAPLERGPPHMSPRSVAMPPPSAPLERGPPHMSPRSVAMPPPSAQLERGPPHMSPRSVAMKPKYVRRSSCVLRQPLTTSNYKSKFSELLASEETVHVKTLKERCDGKYVLFVNQARQKPGELKFEARPDHKRFGHFKNMEGDQVGYATQSASRAVIQLDSKRVSCDILRENNYHTTDRLYIAFKAHQFQILEAHCKITKSAFTSSPLEVHFELKYAYFHWLKQAVKNLPDNVIVRILPKRESFVPVQRPHSTSFEQYSEFCSPDQMEALKVIASCPASGPPVLIAGPFGTGKTRVLAIAAHYFLQQSIEQDSPLRILVCTQQHTSADAYLQMYRDLTKEKEPVTVFRLVSQDAWRNGLLKMFYKSTADFKRDIERSSYRNRQRFLIITTCLTARQIDDVLPHSFFTHIFLDEGAQMREPEAVAPLCMASQNTKIVIAGDKYQVGPAMLVLGEDAQKNGLSISLLERLYSLYHEPGFKDVAKPYCTHLVTNYRCHPHILSLAQQIAYKMPLECKVLDNATHPDVAFPLRFICSSINDADELSNSNTNRSEVEVALKEASHILMKWPVDGWGKRDPSQLCFLSPSRGQVTVARQPIRSLPPQVKNIRKVPTYMIQGQEFRALFVSTSEPTKQNGETLDPTKSISDPFVFITALTRARSLVVAVGNPFLLLKREEHMVAKYGELGRCWSLFLRACLDNDSLTIESMRVTGQQKEKCIQKLAYLTRQRTSGFSLPQQPVTPAVKESSERKTSVKVEERKMKSTETHSLQRQPGPTPSTPPAEIKQPPKPMERRESHSSAFETEYKVKRELGKGGFGLVYHVLHELTKREYAIKIVKLPHSQQDQNKVEREVQALAQLEHPHIVRYFHSWKEQAPADWQKSHVWERLKSSDSVSYSHYTEDLAATASDSSAQATGTSAVTTPALSSESSGGTAAEDSTSSGITFRASSSAKGSAAVAQSLETYAEPLWCLFIKTELCDRVTLREWLEMHVGDRKRKYVFDCFVQILEAVKYIHSKELLHRDLKPSNIFFSLDEKRTVKVGDFGLVTTSQASDEDSVHSSNLGTNFYVSPEQKAGNRYGQKVDIYALGIIFFELNCPFRTQAERAKVLPLLRDHKKFPGKFEDNLSLEAQLVKEMLTQDPSRRPSAEQIFGSRSLKSLTRQLKKKKDALVPPV